MGFLYILHHKNLPFLLVFLCLSFDVVTCQVAIEVEREEDEGGMVGETFTDYVSILIY